MGTFHPDAGALHGVTIVVHCGATVYVGRCHEVDDQQVVLLAADEHTEDTPGTGHDPYLKRAAQLGVENRHERLTLSRDQVTGLVPLVEYFDGQRTTSAATTKPKAAIVDLALAPPSGPTESPIKISEAALTEICRLQTAEGTQGQGLRLSVTGGGCSGMVYKVAFDTQDEGDLVLPFDDCEVYLDRKSAIYLRGVTLDFSGGLGGRGFQFHNPNATNTCGCGESFAV